MKKSDLMSRLVKMADKLDQEGKFELSEKVDQTLKSLARSKAPLKDLEDDVKQNLLVFIGKAEKNTASSIKGLNEFFRRLRYFDVSGAIKEMGLDKVIKDMERIQDCLGESCKKFYEITYGKKPSKDEIDKILGDETDDKKQSVLEFFDAHSEDKTEDNKVEETEGCKCGDNCDDSCECECHDKEVAEEIEPTEQDVSDFWK